MNVEVADEITALIMAWDDALFENKRKSKASLDSRFRALSPDATQEEIEDAIRWFRNRHVKAAKERQRKEDNPKI